MKRIVAALSVLALLLFFSMPAEALVSVEGRYWFSNLDATLKVTDLSVIGTEIDAVDTLGMDDQKGFGEVRLNANFGSHNLRYGYMAMSFDGQKTITQTINFAGQTYTAGTQVDSNLDITYQRIGYRYNIIDTLGNQLGVIFEVKVFDIDASLEAPAFAIEKSHSFSAPIPTIGIGAQISLPVLLSVSAEITGVGYGGNNLIDGEAQINFTPLPFVTLSGGYRIFDVHIEDDDNKVDFTLTGPFLMVRVGF